MTGRAPKSRAKSHCAAAFREAGHAVAAWDRHIMLLPVSILVRVAGAGGYVWNNALKNVDFDWVATAESSALAERLASILLSGTVAQDVFSPGSPKGHIHAERLRQAKTVLGAISNDAGYRRTRYDNARRTVEDFLVRSDVASAVAAVARTLLDRRVILGEEVEAIIETRCRRGWSRQTM